MTTPTNERRTIEVQPADLSTELARLWCAGTTVLSMAAPTLARPTYKLEVASAVLSQPELLPVAARPET